jgi:hypothetical protein
MQMSEVWTLRTGVLAIGALIALTADDARAQTIPETAAQIEALVDFTGPVIVDGDTVLSVEWRATDAPCTFDLVLKGSSEEGETSSELGWTLDFAHVNERVRVQKFANGLSVFLRAKGADFPNRAEVTSTASDSYVLGDFKNVLASGEASGTCTDTSCTLTSTSSGVRVLILNSADTDVVTRPFGLLALLCQSNQGQ